MHRYECGSFNLVLYQSEVSAPTTPSGGIPQLSMLQASDQCGTVAHGSLRDAATTQINFFSAITSECDAGVHRGGVHHAETQTVSRLVMSYMIFVLS